jgi:lysozyme family protein
MSPPPQQMAMAHGLPEEQGIGQLPAPNMQGMAGGGIVAFGPGGSTGADEAFDRAFKKVLKFEGGAKYVKNDAGKGPTKYGINQTANPDVDIKNLTEDQAKEIYRKRYWNAIGGDELAAKNPQLATIAFDAAVNQGPGTAKQMVAESGGEPYKLLQLRQQRYVDLAKQNPEKFKPYLGGWTDRVSSLQQDLEQTRNKQGLPALTPGAQALAATGPETTQPELNSSKAGVISSGLAALGNAAPAVYEAFTPSFAPSTTVPQAVGRTAATASPLAALGLTGGALSAGATNALSNATPEQLDQLSEDVGSDTGLAAAIMNAPNRPPEKPAMPYREQMGNVLGQLGQTAKTVLGHPDTRNPSVPDYAENKTANAYDTGVMGGERLPTAEENIMSALKEKPAEAIVEPEAKKDGTDWNDLMIKMGLNLMASKDPNAISGVGQAGLGTLGMMQAEAKAKSEREAKMSEADYRKAMGEQARAMAGAIERGAKEKNLQLEAEKLIAQELSKNKLFDVDRVARANAERELRATIYRNLGITPTMAVGAPTGGAKFLGFENPT